MNEQHSDWDEKTPDVMLMGISPFEATYGRPPNLPLDNVLRDPENWYVDRPVTQEQEAERLHEHAAEVAEASIRNRAFIQGSQRDRHERNKRQDEGVRETPQDKKGSRCTCASRRATSASGGGQRSSPR